MGSGGALVLQDVPNAAEATMSMEEATAEDPVKVLRIDIAGSSLLNVIVVEQSGGWKSNGDRSGLKSGWKMFCIDDDESIAI